MRTTVIGAKDKGHFDVPKMLCHCLFLVHYITFIFVFLLALLFCRHRTGVGVSNVWSSYLVVMVQLLLLCVASWGDGTIAD